MKTLPLFLLVVTLKTSMLYGQVNKTKTVRAGDDIAQAYSPNGFYRLPQFEKAVLFRSAGTNHSDSLYNYNVYAAEIQFVNKAGDTLFLNDPSLFDSIIIGKNVFYYADGIMELVTSSYPVRLVKKTEIQLRPQTIGAFGVNNSTGTIVNMGVSFTGGNMYSFILDVNVYLKEIINFYFMDAGGKLMKTTEENLLLLLPPEKQEKARVYLKDNKHSFKKEADLKKLFESL